MIDRRDFLALGAGTLAALATPRDSGLVVHEWGVVTVPYGVTEAGIRTAGVRRGPAGAEIEGLPDFVVTWKAAVGQRAEELRNMPVRKPVVYFYSKEEQAVELKVRVPSGRPEAWWPPADDVAPTSRFLTPARLGGRPALPEEIEALNGHLDWRALRVDPKAGGFREASGWWLRARETDATPIRSGREAEKFLYYDAFAAFDPRLEIRWAKGGRARIRNAGESPARRLFAIQVKDGRCRSAHREELAPGETAELDTAEGRPGLVEVLIEAGLYRKEAEGLVKIWSEEWFGFDGARVLSLVPREAYDRLLPLEIRPAPSDLRRVLVAHVECLDAEAEAEVAALVERLASDDPETRNAAASLLRARLPMAASLIREALRTATDPELRGRLEDLLRRPRGR
jgi:hypothetical protein